MPAHSITNTVGGRSCITIENRTPVDPFRPLNNSDNNSFSTLISYPAIACSPLLCETSSITPQTKPERWLPTHYLQQFADLIPFAGSLGCACFAMTIQTFPNSPFLLHQPFAPAGDQPTAIAQLVEGINDGLAFQTLLGVTGSGKTFTMANVIAQLGRPAMVMAPNKTLAAQLYSEFREFFPDNAVEYFVSYYDYYQPEAYVPSRDVFIEKDSAINEQIEQMRLSATKALLEREDCIIVATVSAIYGIGDPVDYHGMILHLRHNEKMPQRDVIKRLVEMQYERNDMDFTRGRFRVRGDVIDVFPAENSELALRITLFDDEVETLSLFDPLTGHIQQKVPRYTVYPALYDLQWIMR